MKNKTLLVIIPNEGTDRLFHILNAETGEKLASHLCSSEIFAYNDLYGQREERKKEWKERFGEIEVKFIGETDLTLETLINRNRKWYAEYQKQKALKEKEESD